MPELSHQNQSWRTSSGRRFAVKDRKSRQTSFVELLKRTTPRAIALGNFQLSLARRDGNTQTHSSSNGLGHVRRATFAHFESRLDPLSCPAIWSDAPQEKGTSVTTAMAVIQSGMARSAPGGPSLPVVADDGAAQKQLRSLKLLIAIPALNEEESIAQTIQRSLAARELIIANSPVTEVEITVVSDGSTDRTVELASHYRDRIHLIVFEKNRGYGAAIKEAWAQSDAELLAFLDADGTCDPNFFSDLCALIEREHADVVLGCRMNPSSSMPRVRRLGNTIFALILSIFSSQRVRDTASGMRVVRRSSLPSLLPLPDGLHFTPAMSARAILSRDLKIVELDMPYHERQGESKLHVLRDGLRFTRVIVDAALLYRPARPLGILGLICGATAVALIVMPTHYYLTHRQVAEWMIYRFVVSHLAATTACLLLCSSYLAARVSDLVLQSHSRVTRLGMSFFHSKAFWAAPVACIALGGSLVIPSFLELVRTGATYEHWSRFIAMSVLFSVAFILIVTWILNYALSLLVERNAYLRKQQP